jgi:hypothetical protein
MKALPNSLSLSPPVTRTKGENMKLIELKDGQFIKIVSFINFLENRVYIRGIFDKKWHF